MNYISIITLALAMSSQIFASTFEITDVTRLDDSSATLVKSPQSPSQFNVLFLNSRETSTCVETKMRSVYGQSSSQCGYDTYTESTRARFNPPIDYINDNPERVRPDARYGRTLPILVLPRSGRQRGLLTEREVRIARTCHYQREVCVKEEQSTETYSQNVQIRLVDFPSQFSLDISLSKEDFLNVSSAGLDSHCFKIYVSRDEVGKLNAATIKLKHSCR